MTRRSAQRKKRFAKRLLPIIILPLVLVIGYLLVQSYFLPEQQIENEIVAPTPEQPVEETEEVEVEEPEPEPEHEVEQPSTPVAEEPAEEQETEYESITEVEVVVDTEKANDDEQENEASLVLANATGAVYTLYSAEAQGSGFLYNTKGDIVTNAHVVQDSTEISVVNATGQTFTGYVIGKSQSVDFAVVRVPQLAGKEPLQMASSMAAIGDDVTAIGSPRNQANVATTGKITATNVTIDDGYLYDQLYEMTAQIEPGSSGGPLFSNKTGAVIGINSIVQTTNPRIGYAMPIHLVTGLAAQYVSEADEKGEDAYQPEEPVVEPIQFTEEFLTAYTFDFNESLYYYLTDETLSYYIYFFKSQEVADAIIPAYRTDVLSKAVTPEFRTPVIQSIEIGEESSTVIFDVIVADTSTEEPTLYQRTFTMEVIIDEFGDYRINSLQ